MAVKYVDEFEFPSDYGFHKPSQQDTKHQPRGMGAFAKPKAGPQVVTGNSRGTGGGKHTTGAVPKFAKGGSWDKHSGVDKESGMGHVENMKAADKAKGAGALKYGSINDKKSPPATRGEKSSGVQRPAFKKGGSTTPFAFKEGGTNHPHGCSCSYCGGGMAKKASGGSIKVAAGKVADGSKTPWNKDDGTSPGSFKRTPPGEKVTNKKAANSKFDDEGRDTEPATKQNGNVERMSEFSDFKRGGKVKKHAKGGHIKATTPQRFAEGGGDVEPSADRYETRDTNEHGGTEESAGTTTSHGMKKGGSAHPHANLGGYLHKKKGGDVKVAGTRKEMAGGKAAKTGIEVNSSPAELASKYESAAGTPGYSEPRGDYYEETSGEPHMAGGGLNRAPSPHRNAAIHAKMDHKAMNALSGIAGALNAQPHQPAAPGMGPPPPGMAPSMGAPPGMAGGLRPAPPMAGGAPGMGGPPRPPGMATGGDVQHIVHHHIHH
jgi:hypothetical protein